MWKLTDLLRIKVENESDTNIQYNSLLLVKKFSKVSPSDIHTEMFVSRDCFTSRWLKNIFYL